MLPRLPQLSTYHWRSMVAGTLALAVALHGVELADVSNIDLARLETRTVRAIWGSTRPGRARPLMPPPFARPHDVARHADKLQQASVVG